MKQKPLSYSEALSEVNKLEKQMEIDQKQKTFWCIVTYIKENTPPLYYCGYYKRYSDENELKPVLSHNFDDAMMLHSKEQAEKIKLSMDKPHWKVEEHSYF